MLEVITRAWHDEPFMVAEAVVSSCNPNADNKPTDPGEPSDREQLSSKEAPGHEILVVDDEVAIRRFFERTLAQAGYSVRTAADGREALAALEAGLPQLVITDLVMPDQEGLETIRTMRGKYPGLRILAVSGAFGGTQLRVAQLLGADAVLGKPVHALQLLEKVAELLAGTSSK